jgi:NAD+ kinase
LAVDLHDNGRRAPGVPRGSRSARPARGATLAPRRVGMLLHPTRDPVCTLTAVSRWAARYDIQVVAAGSRLHRLPSGIAPVALHELLDQVDLLFAAGGDGTVLRAMHLAAPHDVPVLTINLGHLGYLADVDAPRLARYSGDGLIVATAAGSTAYSFAAGGPIVSPALAATVLTPLAPHATFSRPLVLSAGESVEIDVLASSSRVSIEIDGQEHGDAGPGDRLRIASSPLAARRIRVGQIGFASRARSKLRITDAVELDA